MNLGKILFRNKWVSLFDYNGYVYSEETRCGGHIISILPFKRIYENGHHVLKFLLHKELTPAWKNSGISLPNNHYFINSITGGVEHLENIKEDALRELAEEAGYVIEPDKMISLGTSFGSKSNNTIYHYFTCDLTDVPKKDAVGDGSEMEAKEYCEWFSNIDNADDPLVYVAWSKIIKGFDD
jgi:8-oxo-dGTP pyrophosphatase MutT (NUDIX family)